MKPKEYALLEQNVEDGIRRGYSRAYKHADNPTEEQIVDAIHNAVMGGICEAWTFDDTPHD